MKGLGKKGTVEEVVTMVLECFHLVSLLRILRRLMHEKRFLQQYGRESPASCNQRNKDSTFGLVALPHLQLLVHCHGCHHLGTNLPEQLALSYLG